MDIDISRSLRGIAIILLIVGHVARQCLKDPLPIGFGALYLGRWAVMIFLIISGYGLGKKYGFSQLDWRFWSKRFKRLYPTLWMTLILFILLDYILLEKTYTLKQIILYFFGIIQVGTFVNANAWFITYVLYLYGLFFILSYLKTSKNTKAAFLFVLSVLTSIIITLSPLNVYLAFWKQYSLVFPLGVLFGLYRNEFYRFSKYISKNNVFCIFSLIISLLSFLMFFPFNHWGILQFQIIPFMIFLIIFMTFLEKINYSSRLLIFLGKYSYEIFLLHFPFVIKYDFLLHRDPFLLFFFLSFFFYVLLGMFFSFLNLQVQKYSLRFSKSL